MKDTIFSGMEVIRKIAALVVAAMMTVGTANAVMAANATVTIKDGDSHSYQAWQIFTGDESGGVLSNVKWGKNAKLPTGVSVGDPVSEKILEELGNVSSTASDQEKLNTILKYANLEGTPEYTVSGDGTQIVTGYYLFKDASVEDGDTATTYITNVVGDFEIQRKATSVPNFDKTVYDDADGEGNTADETHTDAGFYETADHDLFETYQYKLVATLPNEDRMDDYKNYTIKFNDTLSKGVTYAGNMVVTVTNLKDGASVNYTVTGGVTDATKGNEIKAGASGLAFAITIDDLKPLVTTLKGTVITVTYDAFLNEEAKVGNDDGNRNTASLTYSNNPNSNGDGDKDTTEEDTVYTFTYDMPNTKYANDTSHPLAGAEFTLYQSDGTTVVSLIYDNTIQAYRPIKTDETATVMTSAENTGKFDIKGLDIGTYILKETKTPNGYNTCDDKTIVISASHKETATGATTNFNMTLDGAASTHNQIINNSGTTLPSTGGIGTTIFYVIGAILVLGAGILLVSKRRMSAN